MPFRKSGGGIKVVDELPDLDIQRDGDQFLLTEADGEYEAGIYYVEEYDQDNSRSIS